MAKNAPQSPTKYKFSEKKGQLGALFLMMEKERAYTGVSPKTCELYDSAWTFYAPALETLELKFSKGMTSDERKAEERRLISAIKQRRNDRIDQGGIEGVTLNTYLRNARTFINWLRDEEQGPFLQFDWKKELDKLVVTETAKARLTFTPAQIETFRRFKPGPTKFNQWRGWTIGMCMFDSGIRIDEALNLDVNDFEIDNQMLAIRDGKGGKSRRAPVEAAAMYLMKYKVRWIDPYRTRTDVPWFFFGTHDGKKMSQRNALRDLKVVLKKAGVLQLDPTDPARKRWLPKLSWHNFRHTTATVRLQKGEHLDKVRRLLGHANAKTTAIYLHLSDDYLKEDHSKFSPLTNSGQGKR